MNSSDEFNAKASEPLTFEPEFAFYDGEDTSDESDSKAESKPFAGLPDLDEIDNAPFAPTKNVPVESSQEDIEDEVEPESEGVDDDFSGMTFDDDFNDSLDISDFGTVFSSQSNEQEEPEDSESADEPNDSEVDELNAGLDEFEDPDTSEEGEPDDSETEEDSDEDSDDDDDTSSAGEIAKTAVSALGAASLTALKAAQKGLSKLPMIGHLITSLVRTSVALALIVVIPLVLIMVSSSISRSMTAPSDTASVSLPDEGGAQLSNMKVTDDGKSLTGTITNTGEVIAEVTPSATLKGVNLKDPVSWYVRTDLGTCTGKPVTVDIDDSVDVKLTCDSPTNNVVPEGALE